MAEKYLKKWIMVQIWHLYNFEYELFYCYLLIRRRRAHLTDILAFLAYSPSLPQGGW